MADTYFPDWAVRRAKQLAHLGVEPEDLAAPIERGSEEDHRYHFARKRSAGLRSRMAGEMEIGMFDQCSRAPDGSSNLPDLIEFAAENDLRAELLSYLERVRGFSEDRLAHVRDVLGDRSAEVVDLDSRRPCP